INKTTIYYALCFIKTAWNSVTCETIVNSYEKSLRNSMSDDLLALKININFNEIEIPCFSPPEDFDNDSKFIFENLSDTEVDINISNYFLLKISPNSLKNNEFRCNEHAR
ncbi:hypothetical protein DMUE_6028, partial [Dictyocoela muelleri]